MLNRLVVRSGRNAPRRPGNGGGDGDRPLRGRVRRVEPFGFLKVSALGVEEQRVNVIFELVEPRAVWQRLQHGYRGRVRITTWTGQGVLRVPISALFRSGPDWGVFAVGDDGAARIVRVRIGHLKDEVAEVLSGIEENTPVILHPGERVAEGVVVAERK